MRALLPEFLEGWLESPRVTSLLLRPDLLVVWQADGPRTHSVECSASSLSACVKRLRPGLCSDCDGLGPLRGELDRSWRLSVWDSARRPAMRFDRVEDERREMPSELLAAGFEAARRAGAGGVIFGARASGLSTGFRTVVEHWGRNAWIHSVERTSSPAELASLVEQGVEALAWMEPAADRWAELFFGPRPLVLGMWSCGPEAAEAEAVARVAASRPGLPGLAAERLVQGKLRWALRVDASGSPEQWWSRELGPAWRAAWRRTPSPSERDARGAYRVSESLQAPGPQRSDEPSAVPSGRPRPSRRPGRTVGRPVGRQGAAGAPPGRSPGRSQPGVDPGGGESVAPDETVRNERAVAEGIRGAPAPSPRPRGGAAPQPEVEVAPPPGSAPPTAGHAPAEPSRIELDPQSSPDAAPTAGHAPAEPSRIELDPQSSSDAAAPGGHAPAEPSRIELDPQSSPDAAPTAGHAPAEPSRIELDPQSSPDAAPGGHAPAEPSRIELDPQSSPDAAPTAGHAPAEPSRIELDPQSSPDAAPSGHPPGAGPRIAGPLGRVRPQGASSAEVLDSGVDRSDPARLGAVQVDLTREHDWVDPESLMSHSLWVRVHNADDEPASDEIPDLDSEESTAGTMDALPVFDDGLTRPGTGVPEDELDRTAHGSIASDVPEEGRVADPFAEERTPAGPLSGLGGPAAAGFLDHGAEG